MFPKMDHITRTQTLFCWKIVVTTRFSLPYMLFQNQFGALIRSDLLYNLHPRLNFVWICACIYLQILSNWIYSTELEEYGS